LIYIIFENYVAIVWIIYC